MRATETDETEWNCRGWDGEGCDAAVTIAELADILDSNPLPLNSGVSAWMAVTDVYGHVNIEILGPAASKDNKRRQRVIERKAADFAAGRWPRWEAKGRR